LKRTDEMVVEQLIELVGKSHEHITLLQMRIAQLECAIREMNVGYY
jgi:hypothetical protein